jgi:hypothetical protein
MSTFLGDQIDAAVQAHGGIWLYGRYWPKNWPQLAVELLLFRQLSERNYTTDPIEVPAPEPLIAAKHFKNAAQILFGPHNQSAPFIWHPWADDMLEEACLCKRLGISGSSTSGKSGFMAVWAIINFLAAPEHTLVLVTSTDVRASKKRVWGAVQRYWQSLEDAGMDAIGKYVDFPSAAIYSVAGGGKTEEAGIYLIPSERSKEKEASGKMRGMKAKAVNAAQNGVTVNQGARVFCVFDELTDLSHAVLKTALNNLTGNRILHIIGAANPNSRFDPFGMFCEPDVGWDNINEDTGRWTTKMGGVCLHFDALKSPNYLARKNIYPFLQPYQAVEEAIRLGDANSPEFWRDFRGFWCPSGVSNGIFSEVEILMSKSTERCEWAGAKVKVAGLDPSFSMGGDRTILWTAWYGRSIDGIDTVELDKFYEITQDVRDKERDRDTQIADRVAAILDKEGVAPINFAVDATGAGSPFCSVLATALKSRLFLRVEFGGAPSVRPVSSFDPTPCNEKYSNRVTELWFFGKELMRNSQLRGIPPELALELTQRLYQTLRRDNKTKLLAEPKEDMRRRTQKSPDIADGFCVLLELVRERFGFSAVTVKTQDMDRGTWKKAMKKFDVIGRNRKVIHNQAR